VHNLVIVLHESCSAPVPNGFPMVDISKLKVTPRTRIVRFGDREIISEGLANGFWTDLNHRAMTASWPAFFASALGLFLSLNIVFALIYSLGADPIANAAPGNLLQLFFFSVETLATVGYGDMHPQTLYAHAVATAEIFTGMSLIAVMTGLVFSRFSRPRARLVFAKRPVIGQHDGKPTLMLRLANARQNRISGATARLWLLTTERTIEDRPYRRFRELKLIRNENPTFALSWTIFHVINAHSPLSGATPQSLAASDAGLLLTVTGVDEQLVQELHSRNSYTHADVAWGEHYADILSTDGNGRTRIEYSRLDETEPDAKVGE
jgi:inward rectifier potassium channel